MNLDDDFFGKHKWIEYKVWRHLRNPLIFPIRDKIHYLKNEEECRQFYSDLRLEKVNASYVSYYEKDFEMLSDEGFSRMFFHYIASPLVAS